eukprot:6461432-Amphidinium_carterae.2
MATAKQQDQDTDLRRKLQVTGPCTCFEWPSLWIRNTKSWRTGLPTDARNYSPDQTVQAELTAWSKLWQLGSTTR